MKEEEEKENNCYQNHKIKKLLDLVQGRSSWFC